MAKDALLDIPGIPGESEDSAHAQTIEISNWNFGVAQEATIQSSAGLVAGGASFDDFTIEKTLDKASPLLFKHCASGKKIDSAKLYVRRAGDEGGTPVEYLIFEFKDLLVSSFSCNGASGSAIPDETIAFSFGWYKQYYREIKNGVAQGPISKGYDLKQNLAE